MTHCWTSRPTFVFARIGYKSNGNYSNDEAYYDASTGKRRSFSFSMRWLVEQLGGFFGNHTIPLVQVRKID
jgi:hypothetical protein